MTSAKSMGSKPMNPINQTDVEPFDLRILVKLDKVEDRTKGGIILTDASRQADQQGAVRGTLVAAGENAWNDTGRDFHKPVPGDRVMIGRHTGTRFKEGDDLYALCNDEDVVARLSA